MEELQAFSVLESTEQHTSYIPHSKFEKFTIFCKKWWTFIFVIIFCGILLGFTVRTDSKLRSMKEESKGKLNQSYESVINKLTSEIQALNDKLTVVNNSQFSQISDVQKELEFYRRAASASNCKEFWFKDIIGQFDHSFRIVLPNS